jgi:TetR/AcrR family transcriptional repressor of nem operon
MPLEAQTKEKILEIGAEIIHSKGFNHTGIQEILQAAEIPKGSFYFYFKNKEDFGLQVIDFFVNQFNHITKDMLEDASIPPLERIKRVLEWFKEFFKSNDYTNGCPVGNLSQEMGDLSPNFREKLKGAIDSMAGGYAKVLQESQNAGEISKQLDVEELAYFIVSSWHGALIRMKVEKGPKPLENHIEFIFDHILRS